MLLFSIINTGTFYKSHTNEFWDDSFKKKKGSKREWKIHIFKQKKQLNVNGMLLMQKDILRGKHKPTYTPNIDCGDYVIVLNAAKINLTGNKLEDKKYYNHSRYAGGMRVRTAKEMKEKYPEEMMELAIKGMLPKGRLGRQMYRKLFVYAGESHPHTAQQPVELKMN